MESWQRAGFGLYLHWPFCQSKCPYCDFNSHVAQEIDQKRWEAAYLSEIDRIGSQTQGRVLQTVYFGGGTPSLMRPELVAAILQKIRATWPMSNDVEITLEANPGSVEMGRFKAYRDAGVSRVSLGLQALNDSDLKRLGRLHTAKEALQAFDIARNIYDRSSFDLIYARQGQTLDGWRKELTLALSYAVDHLSLYQLTVEEGTVFAARLAKGGLKGLPQEDLAADMYSLTQEICDRASLFAYEVSNHARPGAESRHNLIYWRGGDYIGIGPGAHGRLSFDSGRYATEATRSPNAWLEAVEKKGFGEMPRTLLNDEERALEYLLMSLRLTEGMRLSVFNSMSPAPMNEGSISKLVELGMIAVEEDILRATSRGRLVLNAVIKELAGG